MARARARSRAVSFPAAPRACAPRQPARAGHVSHLADRDNARLAAARAIEQAGRICLGSAHFPARFAHPLGRARGCQDQDAMTVIGELLGELSDVLVYLVYGRFPRVGSYVSDREALLGHVCSIGVPGLTPSHPSVSVELAPPGVGLG